MTLPPGRFGYRPITERPKLEWPDGARVAFWVAPNIEHYEYTPLNRPDRPDIPDYALKDYGNRVAFWRMYDVLCKYKVRATACLNLGTLDHFPEVKDAMIADDQPLPIKVKGGEPFCYVPYSGQTNDAGVLSIREADYLCEMVKRQFDTLYGRTGHRLVQEAAVS